MARVRRYIDTDVLTEAKRRLHHVMDTFDNWVVAFSGGKDSLAALRLVKEVQDERGDRSKVRALFRDEEFIPQGVVDFVTELRSEPWLDLEWWCVPQRATHVILGAADQHYAGQSRCCPQSTAPITSTISSHIIRWGKASL